MLGILVILMISWLLLHFLEGKNLLSLGFTPLPRRLMQFSIGFMVSGILCVLDQVFEAQLKSALWNFNRSVDFDLILKSFFWDFKSVLTEELIFRGAILYILIRRLSASRSILISAIAFGVYHWFSYGVLGNVMAMILVFIGTGLMGYAWALAFAKTRSIMLPFGLHLGWNAIYNTVFSKGPLGELLFVLKDANELTDWTSLFDFVSGLIIVPLIVLILVKYLVKDETDLKS